MSKVRANTDTSERGGRDGVMDCATIGGLLVARYSGAE